MESINFTPNYSDPLPNKKMLDLRGRRFGRLIVLAFAYRDPPNIKWLCLCDCGKSTIVTRGQLTSGRTRSCGCLVRDTVRRTMTTHGMSYSRAYGAWYRMLRRCYSEKNTSYKNYGGRGITVCDRWRESFDNFYHDMGECPDKYELDRIDPNGNYEPANCRWADRKTQARNRRNNRRVTFNGETKTIVEWAEITGINYSTLYGRLFAYKWSPERAFTTPVAKPGIKRFN